MLLQQIYGKIFIPTAVYNELTAEGAGELVATAVQTATWIETQQVANRSLVTMMHNSPEDFIRAMRSALERGDYGTAQQLSTQAVEHYPDHKELLKYAYVLAPPKVTVDKRPPDRDTEVNQDWVRENRTQYRGRWVALRNGQLLASARKIDELVDQLSDTKGVFLTGIY